MLSNDTQGADRIVISPTTGPITAGTFTGTYGTLMLAADGSYTYTLNPEDADFKGLKGGGAGTETFTYTLTDADGDTSTATLTLNINNLNDPVTLNGLGVAGGELTVFERNLSDGSTPDNSALTQTGTFTVTAPDGLQSLTVGGINVLSGGIASGFPQTLTTALGNTLTITGYNASTGVVSYSYTLSDNEAHPTANGANSLSESFVVSATDTDGSTATDSLDVTIVDDLPTAANDGNLAAATEQQTILTGNVLSNDTQGADRIAISPTSGPITAGTFTGTYGTLVLAADGSYTYTLNPDDADFKGLKGGGAGTETFTYTLADADGDTSTATLTLDINNLNDPVTLNGLNVADGELTVFERHLSDGSTPDGSALTQNGTFTVTAPDGLQTLTVGGINVLSGGIASGFPQTLITALGNTLTITGYNASTGVVSYSYTLSDNEAHPTANGANSLSESFTVSATDSDGSTATDSLDVTIVDDLPTAANDDNLAAATEQQTILTGNVLSNDTQGADRIVISPTTGPITAGTFTGTYGTLMLAADGSYTYTLNPEDADFKGLKGGGAGTETFTYTLTDADGDTSTATLTLDINNLNDPVTLNGLNVAGGELTVFERHLSDGSTPDSSALTQSGTFTINAPDGLQTLTVGGINVVTAGVASGFPQSLTTALGNTLTITGYNASTGVVSYSYTLTDNEAHPTANGANSLSESFTVSATDSDGSTATGNLDVTIVDDLPTAANDGNLATATEQQTILTGNVLTNDTQGADRITLSPTTGPIIAGTFTGTYGTLVLAADGSYTYTLDTDDPDFLNLQGGGSAIETFTYTLTDADGDTSTATLTLDISNLNDPVTLNGLNVAGGELTVFERHLSDGSTPDNSALTQTGTFTVNAPDGLQSLNVGGINVLSGGIASGFPQTLITALGNTLTITGYNVSTGVVSYSYTLTDNEAHPTADGANSLSESFVVSATDTDGSTATDNLDVTIVDDLPTAANDGNLATATEQQTILTGNVLSNDTQGADRIAVSPTTGPITAGTFTGTYGTLVLAADGSYTYTLNPDDADFKGLKGGGAGTETFTYTLADADGDTSTATLTLNINNLNDPVTFNGLDVAGGELTVFEKHLSDGSTPDSSALTQSGTFTINAPDGLQTLTVGGINVVTAGMASGFPQSLTTALGNTLTITGYNASTSVVSYSYTLIDNEAHPTANGANSLGESFTVSATDSDGSTATGNLDINIVDDLPQAYADFANVYEGGTISGNVLVNDMVGADAPTVGTVIGVRAGGDTATSAVGQLDSPVTGQYGYLTLDAQGNAVYHANPDSVAPVGAIDMFTYTIRDSDSDESTATVTVKVHDCSLMTSPDAGVTVFEKALDTVKDSNDLAAGNVTGSNPSSSGETASGSLAGSVSGGIGALTYSLTSAATGQYGQIALAADGTYTYTLTSAPQSPGNLNDGAGSVTESFTYEVRDALGNSTTSTVVITIVDDVPTAHCDVATVKEGASVSGNVLDNDVIGADVPSNGSFVVGVRAGSDTTSSALGQLGVPIGGTYGYLTLDAQGNAVYHANPNSVAPGGAVDTFVYTLRDGDGDESTTTITINVQDSKLIACPDTEISVFEKALDLVRDGKDLAAGTAVGSDPSSTGETASGSLVGSVGGGIGALSYSLEGSTSGLYGQLQLDANGTYTYTLTSAPRTPDGANAVSEQFTYRVTDSLGNSTTSTLAISIIDDTPKAVCAQRSITPGQLDSNLLLVIDVSGSMNLASGVAPGQSRLDLAKQAIGVLLDKYDEMGDIKVQVVTFATGASVESPVWLSVADAKSLVAGLTADGSTYYDSAAKSAQAAFATPGRLEGAQNVGYFFSDGIPTEGHALTADRAAVWERFLDDNLIKAYAIGLGTGADAGNLDPLAYDGSTRTDTGPVVVTDLAQLGAVLSGTVQGAPITGSLMSDGHFGADGGFIKALLVDGVTYTFDPGANDGLGGVSGGADKGYFDTLANTLNIRTDLGGTWTVDMDSGEYTYAPPKDTGGAQLERLGFIVSDNDGDTSSASLVVNVRTNTAPLAGDDRIITNIAGAVLDVPAQALLANDRDVDHDPLSAAPLRFATGFADKGAGFTLGSTVPTIAFKEQPAIAANQLRDLPRSAFVGASGSMTAALVVAGFLGRVSDSSANDEDVLSVTLRKGETLTLDHDRPLGNLMMAYVDPAGTYQLLADGDHFTAADDGLYRIHLVNLKDAGGWDPKAAEYYNLSLSIDYSKVDNPVHHASYVVSDNHGGTDTGQVTIAYQAGHTLQGTAADDVLLAGAGNDTLQGGDGNDVLAGGDGQDLLYGGSGDDLLIGGAGNDLLDGGTGVDTASYASASGAVRVELDRVGAQDTGSAGADTLTGIENLIGSDYDDVLVGNAGDNVLDGGRGNDALMGGAGSDTLVGGQGDDILTGGAGSDTFVWQKGDSGHDLVADFTPGGDHLDLSQLLQGENATAASLDDYLHFKVSGAGATVVSTIEVSAVAGAAANQTIDLAGVNLAQHYGVTMGAGGVISAGQDTATIITGMLDDHSLKVDTV
nr:Ig-like domain-containing protein [Pseudomonas capeferrum]